MAKKKDKKKGTKKGGKSKLRLGVMYVFCVVMAVIFKGSFIFVLVGMLPTIAAYISDKSEGKEIYRCVLACNVAGMLPYVAKVFAVDTNESLRVIADPSMWLGIYVFAGIGWLLVWIMPHLAEVITELSQFTRVARLEENQRKLIEEWGPEIQRKLEITG
ncbi:MAG: hypothetical protein K2Q12_02760 [Rickettsiales bacterium]|nr:hypothetical protein [Rickettsiales bacterium]